MSQTFDGADVSHWQGQISWSEFNPGAAFVFIKAGGGDDGMYTDPQFNANKSGVRALGSQMPHGFYWFGSSNDATDEATYFVNNCVSDLQVGEALVLDSESGSALSPDWCLTWLNQVEALTGVKPLIYMSASKTTSQDWSQVVAGNFGLWVADYSVPPTGTVPIGYWSFYAFQQFADNGSFPGISGNVDRDAFFSEAITDFYKYGKQPAPVVAPPLQVEVPAPAAPASTDVSGTSATPTPPTSPEPPPSTGATTPTTPSGTNVDGVITSPKVPGPPPTTSPGVVVGPQPKTNSSLWAKMLNALSSLIKWLKL